MLQLLTVVNFALIEQCTIEFGPGLNVLTGETGAGKSILIDALNMALGGRASVDSIRSGTEGFRAEAVFDLEKSPEIEEWAAAAGIPFDDGHILILSRRLNRSGRNTAMANGSHISLPLLRQLGDRLLDMHGQHENQALLRPETHLELLDSSSSAIEESRRSYEEAFRQWREAANRLDSFRTSSRERAQRQDILAWQCEEIGAARLNADEEAGLEDELRFLANAEKLAKGAGQVAVLLSRGGQASRGVLAELAEARRELESLRRFDHRLEPLAAAITDSYYALEDAASGLKAYAGGIDFDPSRLERLQDRKDLIQRLKRKYGPTITDVIDYHANALRELSSLGDSERDAAVLEDQTAALWKQVERDAAGLDNLRREAAVVFERQANHHMAGLGMGQTALRFLFAPPHAPGPTGITVAQLMFSANAGEDLRPLAKIASGGELSRTALAVKCVAAARDGVGALVFDEIDAGIGGQTAQKVAEKIALVAMEKQVLCITHLPQIACMARTHIVVEKGETAGRTVTLPRVVAERERLSEIARMISGDELTALALDNAAEMLANARKRYEKLRNEAQA